MAQFLRKKYGQTELNVTKIICYKLPFPLKLSKNNGNKKNTLQTPSGQWPKPGLFVVNYGIILSFFFRDYSYNDPYKLYQYYYGMSCQGFEHRA